MKTAKKSAKKSTKKSPKKTAKKGAKLDLYVLHRDEYVTPASPVLVDVGRAYYLAIDGAGAPGGPEFTEAVGALYGVAFTIKMARKSAGTDYVVSKLEALWGGNSPNAEFATLPPEQWHWTAVIRIPDFIAAAEIAKAVKQLVARGKSTAVQKVKRLALTEGKCVQVLHVGPYSAEPATVERMKAFAAERGLTFRGTHHDIYFSDPRRVPESKLRTILRVPVGK